MELIKLKKGNKIIKRYKSDYQNNKEAWDKKGYSIADVTPKVDKPKKKKGKK